MKVQITSKEISDIPEVMEFEQAKTNLQYFKQQNSLFFQTYEYLANEYNRTLEAADKVVRGEGVKCGDWDLYQQFSKYDWEKLYNALGREQFIAVGGIIKNKKEFKGDTKRLEMSVAKGLIPEDVYTECAAVEQRYHAPSKLSP